MTKIEIDQKGYVIGLCGLDLEKGDRLCEMSADQTLCLLPEKCEKGFATRIVTMDGDVRLVGKTSGALVTEMAARNYWGTPLELSAYYALYENAHKCVNKAKIGSGVAFYPVTDSERNTSWINVSVITGVTGTVRGSVIETSVGLNFKVTKNADNVRADLAAIRVISHWMCQVNGANHYVHERGILNWLNWPTHASFQLDVILLQRLRICCFLGHLLMQCSISPKWRQVLTELAEAILDGKYDNYRRVNFDKVQALFVNE
ncbi:hypothetical protein EFL57_04550 [Weissella confusa]|uniref:hypothetical protein n=1 Tax=Weissella confusa TaxID=1583 RepID=UPI00223B893F|nr:hypothetical protein [Weissella confusa]MCT0009728.1 hypothetical protein [Weissella confusa]